MLMRFHRQSVIAWQAIVASAAYQSATVTQGIVINSQSSYIPQRWHGTLMVIALMCICLAFNTFLARWLPRVETAILALHITLFVVILVVMTVMSPMKTKSADVWALFLNAGGYESKGLSFFVGLITPVFAFSGADGAVHMSEEIKNSSSVVPWAMMSMLLACVCVPVS
jgi:choline transport protein